MGASPLEPGRVVAGRYRVESQIGEGGMGSVFLVSHVHTDEKLALKLVHAHVLKDASAVERFRREARTPARITSEHVARVTDADVAADLDDAPFYVMEYLRGRDLEHIVVEQGPIAPALVVEYLRQTARALDKAHAIGIVHRDLKPENLFLTHRDDDSPCIKLLDFGIARLADADGASPMKTQAGYVFGTPGFMAPEQMTGEVDKIGPAADIWAIGLVAFRLLVARDFWNAQTPAHMCAMVLSEPIPTPTERGSTLGPAFDAWFARCVARKIEDRFASASEAVAALGEALGVRVESMRSSASLVAAGEAATQAALEAGHSARINLRPPVPSSPGVPVEAAVPLEAVAPAAPARGSRVLVVAIALGLVFVLAGGGAAVALLKSPRPKAEGLVGSASPAASTVSVPGSSASSGTGSWASAEAEPTASASAPAPAATKTAGGIAAIPTGAGRGPGTRDTSAASAARDEHNAQNREQKKRIEALQRLCDQGTFTPEECKAKRAAILHGGH